ncbi:MAG: 2,3,4,5-tetrahydropyridine-2,6-dicarboxylate N-succinyltransferase [Acidimicrobiales bacterium]
MTDLEAEIGRLWIDRERWEAADDQAMSVVRRAINLLDTGQARVAEVIDDNVVVHEWLKRALLLYLVGAPMETSQVGPFEISDRVPLKSGLADAGVRALPGSIVRWGAFIGSNSVLMPSFVNVGARVGTGTMIDTWATVGSCAQVGNNVHISGGVGLGGVLEPPQAAPVIIEDDAFVGSRSMVTEGARVGPGAMLGAGVVLNPSIPVIDAETGTEVGRGIVPPWCLVINATRARDFPGGTFGLPCALIIKRFTEGERHDKARLNDLLRHHGASL